MQVSTELVISIISVIIGGGGAFGWWTMRAEAKRASAQSEQIKSDIETQLWDRSHQAIKDLREQVERLRRDVDALKKEIGYWRALVDSLRAYVFYLLNGISEWADYARAQHQRIYFTPIQYSDWIADRDDGINIDEPDNPPD